ncbi:MAG: inorganic phosphate transporter [Planctomycetota bacterium]|jgi:PiT family inorganic phosphate transporter
MFGLDFGLSVLLLICIAFVCVFEFINGFHDTANAVATVIYTNTLKPQIAVVYSAILNAIGVFLGGIAVAVGIINMLPVETLISQNTLQSLGMVGAILLTAIFWNFGTWYLGIPASSTHTLVGSILGCGIAYSLLPGTGETAVNWKKASEVGLSLLISPLIGFLLAVMVMGVLRWTVSNRRAIFQAPEKDATPPFWIRAMLIATCGLVSYSHGSNDGQKGIGLMMLVLIGIIPAQFALSDRFTDGEIQQRIEGAVGVYEKLATSDAATDSPAVAIVLQKLKPEFEQLKGFADSRTQNGGRFDRFAVRRQMLLLNREIGHWMPKNGDSVPELQPLQKAVASFRETTDYAPNWVIVLVALSIGLGTMIGWKRIVVTVGEKIGKTHLTYAQGASAELVAASTIGLSTFFGLPVSTTQVLSSGIAGSMFASGGFANLQKSTITKIALAWVLTFPVCLTMSGTLYLLIRAMVG